MGTRHQGGQRPNNAVVMYCLYPMSQKSRTPYSRMQLCQMLTGFQNSFTSRLSSKHVMKSRHTSNAVLHFLVKN